MIMKYIFQSTDLNEYVQEGDCLIYDRGFSDIVADNRQGGLEIFMPSMLPNGKRTIYRSLRQPF